MSEEFVGESGGGLVKVIFNDKGKAIKVEMDDSIFTKDDKQFISDLFVSAVNSGFEKVDVKKPGLNMLDYLNLPEYK